ncbi:hypothetical protein GPY51_17725 [Photorhabdus laumondii subsp. laumondii]|uniref:Uncharacterized protein n=1 Tax=Photorhabdus laumondii subsp. laumondii TaxID=141679 RepID=A0A6L9JMN0_PHOLM|nr:MULTISPECIES: hypothetical protein [Photorhabdus]NDL18471.1 hypothetical protein [Photorhabdus laumondii subsp. laumondii]NDL19662.1 hypothetical protein [Photorhabdus laumondii subsp. laumondii]NDL31467.1 hypothetical protein [Photorhabdus laumondii subsp. laumondii]NDL33244.1 hypothetical protein [Photorhabdus laumondii subsp. laumondii]NDL40548.1 hypothetical protein [Photorhabdus laumondii subsp. laumondii]
MKGIDGIRAWLGAFNHFQGLSPLYQDISWLNKHAVTNKKSSILTERNKLAHYLINKVIVYSVTLTLIT